MSTPTPSTQEQKENKALLVALSVVVIASIVLAIIGFVFLNKPADIIEGQADATSVRISGKLPGRVMDIYVSEGDMVRARKTYDRLQNLYDEGVVSEQKRDEAKAAYDAAVAGHNAAKSQLELAIAGAQKEDKESAAAMVNVAKGGVAEVQSVLEDQYLLAPCDGQIDQIYPEVSELVMLGAPIMSLLKTQDKWVTFNVREDLLKDMPLGGEIEVMIPALDKKKVKAKIYYSRDLGSYATWQATKATGQWDSKTFEIKARPLEDLPELRPGMTVVYFK